MFDKNKHQVSMRKAVDKLVTELKKSGITFTPQEGEMENVGFRKDDKLIVMSHHSFYRYSGIAVRVVMKKDQPEPEIYPVTDEIYLMQYIKPIILTLFAND